MIKINARKAVSELLKNIKDGEEVDPSSLSSQLEGMDEATRVEAMKILNSSIQPVITKQEHKKVEVLNFPEPIGEVSVKNLSDLDSKLKAIEDAVKAIRIEAPIINLPAPEVNVPETVLNIPAVDFTPLLNSLEKSLKLLRTNSKSNPLAVRLTDGADWIRKLIEVQKETNKAVAAFAGGNDRMLLLDSNRNPVNPATADSPSSLLNNLVTVTTAGTRVQVSASSVACKGITVKSLAANTGTMYVGNSTVASTNGYPLAAGQAISFDISNLSTVYIDASVNGEKVAYLAVN